VDLVDSLMDAARWSEMFPCIVARASTTDIISSGMGGTRSGSIQLMHTELQVLSPLVPIREVVFLRFCKQHAEGLWAVVDVSVDAVLRPGGDPHHHPLNGGGAAGYMGCRLLPSGCVVQDMNNGYSKVRIRTSSPGRRCRWPARPVAPPPPSGRLKSARRSGMWWLQYSSNARI